MSRWMNVQQQQQKCEWRRGRREIIIVKENKTEKNHDLTQSVAYRVVKVGH